jgi:hypothetical protein
MPAMIAAIAGIVVSTFSTVGIYLRGKAKSIAVSATFDKTGFVQVLIKKKGTPTVHVRDVKLLRAGTNKALTTRSRYPIGGFDIAGAGNTAYDCYYLLHDAKSADDGVDIEVWLDEKTKRKATATRSEQAIKLPGGVTLQSET